MSALPRQRFGDSVLSAVSLDIRRPGTFVRAGIQPGFEIGSLLDQASRNIGVRDRLGKFEKRRCLLCQILSTDHFFIPRFASPADATLHRGFRSEGCVTK